MLGVRLREHHELRVRGIALEVAEGLQQVVDLVRGQGEAEGPIGLHQRIAAFANDRHGAAGRRRVMGEEQLRLSQRGEHELGHAVVQVRRHGRKPFATEVLYAVEVPGLHAFHAHDVVEAAAMDDIRSLAGPG